MLHRRLLIAGGGASVAVPVQVERLALYNGQNGDGFYKIGAASFDGTTWTDYASNPVLIAGTGWESHHVKDPCLLFVGGEYVLYYSGSSTAGGLYQIGRATAPSHEGPWTKDASNPVLDLGSGGSFDDAGVNFPTVLYEPTDTGKEWKMWYGANDGSDLSIGYAHSSDGLSWTKVGQVLTKGAGGTWEDESILPMAIYKSGATYTLFYGGYQDPTTPFWQGGIATFTDPEGTYTKDAGNPTLLARFNDAGVFQNLSGGTLGATQVTVDDTTDYNVGEMVVVADGDSQTGVHRIVSKDSATLVTLTPALANAYTSGSPAFRPLAGVSVIPRSVLAVPGGFEMFGTAFQPVEDLTVGGTKLREAALRWTATDLDGSWTYDYTPPTILFDLYPSTTGWHQFSAENPSVIVTP